MNTTPAKYKAKRPTGYDTPVINERTKSYCAGASVLIYSRSRTGEISLLLGQDSEGEHKWSDFGGGAQKRESSWACAARELHEETHGLFADKVTPDYLRLQSRVTFKFPSKKTKGKVLHYATFLFRAPHRNQTANFLHKRARLSKRELALTCRTEKQQLQFVPVSKIKDLHLRSFFKQRLQHILPHLIDSTFTIPSFTVALGGRRMTPPPKKNSIQERRKLMTKDQQSVGVSMLSTFTPPVSTT